jgi:S-adenosylmethionine:tRNA-ribosyltransferase-isomerase (queuine synthetase)
MMVSAFCGHDLMKAYEETIKEINSILGDAMLIDYYNNSLRIP